MLHAIYRPKDQRLVAITANSEILTDFYLLGDRIISGETIEEIKNLCGLNPKSTKEKPFTTPVQTIKPTKQARPDLLTAGHWQEYRRKND